MVIFILVFGSQRSLEKLHDYRDISATPSIKRLISIEIDCSMQLAVQ